MELIKNLPVKFVWSTEEHTHNPDCDMLIQTVDGDWRNIGKVTSQYAEKFGVVKPEPKFKIGDVVHHKSDLNHLYYVKATKWENDIEQLELYYNGNIYSVIASKGYSLYARPATTPE